MDVPQDAGQRNIAAEEKPHRPMLKRVRDKARKIRNTITGHGHGNGDEHEHEPEHEHDTSGSRSIDMDEVEVEDVEDKSATDSGHELHGAPMDDSETIPSAAKDVERNDATEMRLGDLGGQAAAKDLERNDDPAVRLDDLGGQAAAKDVERNDDPAVRLGDLGGQAAAKDVERNDDQGVRLGDLGGQAAAKDVERNDANGMRLGDLGGQATARDVDSKDATGMQLGDLGGQAAAKDVERNDDPAVRLDDVGGPAAVKDAERNDDPAVLLGDLGGQAAAKGVERNDDLGVQLGDLGGPVVEDPAAPHSTTPTPRGGEDIGTTDVVRDFQAMTVSDDPKQAGAEKLDRDQIKETEAMPVSDGTGEEEEWTDAPTDAAYTGNTTEDGKNLASTDYEKVAGVGTVAGGNAQDDSGTTEPMDVDAGKRDLDLPKEGTPAAYPGTEELKNTATDATTEGAHAATYTDMFKSAAAGTTAYGMQLASSAYTAVANRMYTTSPGVGAQDGSAAATVTPGAAGPGNGQDKGVSETVQPTTEGNIGGGVAAEGPTLPASGEEIEAPRTNTNAM